MLDERQLPLGYKTLVSLDKDIHGQLGIARLDDYSFSAAQHVIMVTWMEMINASRDYPLIFIAAGRAENLMPVILTGVNDGENLYVNSDGSWQEECYIPATIRRYPFYTFPYPEQEEDQRRLALFVDETALSDESNHFFDSDGNPTPYWQELENFFADLDGELQQTESFMQILQDLELLEQFNYQVSLDGKEYAGKPGMLRINEAKLNELPADKLKALQENGSLVRIHAHLISLKNFDRLYKLKTKRYGTA
ncbi:MAG: SapC family protein [Candidatus Thiodiazotropha taylori]|nr:SapC family protein [Candidatus Thiodiazotropha taylori]